MFLSIVPFGIFVAVDGAIFDGLEVYNYSADNCLVGLTFLKCSRHCKILIIVQW